MDCTFHRVKALTAYIQVVEDTDAFLFRELLGCLNDLQNFIQKLETFHGISRRNDFLERQVLFHFRSDVVASQNQINRFDQTIETWLPGGRIPVDLRATIKRCMNKLEKDCFDYKTVQSLDHPDE